MEKVDQTIAAFTQSETRTKQFRNSHPITGQVRSKLLKTIYPNFTEYIVDRYYNASQSMIQAFIDDHDLEKVKQKQLNKNLFYWKVLYDTSQDNRQNIVEQYIAEHYYLLEEKPLIISWLREWEKIVPSFYQVRFKINDRILRVMDLLKEKVFDVIIYDPLALPPKKDGILMGALIPIGDGLHFPIIDFYHFDITARHVLINHLKYHDDKYPKNTTKLTEFLHLLSISLQIEQLVMMHNKVKEMRLFEECLILK